MSLKSSLFLGTSIAAFALITPAMAQNASGSETVIVTGTRVQGMTAADSAAPIQVLGSDALTQSSGSQDIRQSLGQTVPSFTSENFGGDLANMTLSANLRGLSPNDTLVLVNGHRRHLTAAFSIGGGSGFSGGSSPDISWIPTASIDHVEVLLEGAAAQYGSDAIAGVVNFILKKNSSGGQVLVTGGRRYNNEGEQYDYSVNTGLPLFDKGYVNLTFDKQYRNFVQLGGADIRLIDPTGGIVNEGVVGYGATAGNNTYLPDPATGIVPCSGGICIPLATRQGEQGYPRSNHENTSPEIIQTSLSYNAGYDFSDNFSIYSFGTWGHRWGKGMENIRQPNQNIAAPGSNQPCSATNPQGYATAWDANGKPACALGLVGWYGNGVGTQAIPGSTAPGTITAGLSSLGQPIYSGASGTLYTPGELIQYPYGFEPQEAVKDTDYQYNLGTTANLAGWNVDASVSYGKDINNIYTLRSGNRSLFIDTHTTPSNFYDGTFVASEFVGNIDVTHQFDVGLAGPLNFAFGFEAREDFYEIKPGDAASQYKEGGQSFPGWHPTDAGPHSRKNYSAYVDFEFAPIETIDIDIAGRAEHYSDFGDTQIGKITARWDITPAIAVRGTMSTGFRAPNLQEEWYSATNVGPLTATLQLPANSAAAKILGFSDLQPEISTSYSAGIVAHPLEDLNVTLDAYSITLGNRIVGSSTVHSSGSGITTPLVTSAIAAAGVILDPTAGRVGARAFVNGLFTLSQGVDLTVNYPTDLGDAGLINWTIAGNYNTTALSRVAPPPAVLTASNPAATFFQPGALFNFVHSAPNIKVGLTANWTLGAWGVTARETVYGADKALTSPTGEPPYYDGGQPSVGITDLEGRYNITEGLQLAVGGNNIFNINARTNCIINTGAVGAVTQTCNGGLVIHSPVGTPFDPYHGYYYGRVTYKW